MNGVGALIYAKDTGRFLFLLRDQTSYSGAWGLVGGKVDRDETTRQALLREIREEIGQVLDNVKIIPLELFTSINKNFTFNTYIIIVDREFLPVLNREHRAYTWCKLEDHPKPLHPGVYGTFKLDEIKKKISIAVSCT
jgi:8-oxo-dGTP pyrophosphatase MutT (NUDIX family)